MLQTKERDRKMTGRELINYILNNGLEDEDVFKNGNVVGLKTVADVAEECNVGKPTVYVWARLNMIPSVSIGNELFIQANYTSPIESAKKERCNNEKH